MSSRIILPVPHYPQDEAGECLAVCGLMVLTFMEERTTLPQLRKILGINWFGTSFSNIRSLTQLGIRVEMGEGTLEQLRTALAKRQPPIVAVDTTEFSYTKLNTLHAVVLVGIDEAFVYLHDPMVTTKVPICVPIDEFALAWLEHDELFAILSK